MPNLGRSEVAAGVAWARGEGESRRTAGGWGPRVRGEPMNTDPTRLGAREAARRIRGGKLSPVELGEARLARIRALDAELKASVHVDETGALALAHQPEADGQPNPVLGPLHGA